MSDDEAIKRPKPKRVLKDDDDDAPVVRKAVAKAAPAADDDDAPVVRRAAKKVVASDSDDDAKVHAPRAKKAVAAKDSDDDDIVAVRKAKHIDPSADNDDDTVVPAGRSAQSSSTAVDLIDYDSMTEAQFLTLLNRQSKQERLAEKKLVAERLTVGGTTEGEQDRHFDGTPAYSYSDMLDRILKICLRNNPELSQAERIKLPMPKIEKIGSKRTCLINFKEICNALNRSLDDVKDFIEKTLTVQSSVDSDNHLILRYQNAKVQNFEKLFSKYVEEFVKCAACGRIHTELEKESSSRLLVMKCRDCKASRYIQTAGAATFKAQTGKRRDRPGMM